MSVSITWLWKGSQDGGVPNSHFGSAAYVQWALRTLPSKCGLLPQLHVSNKIWVHQLIGAGSGQIPCLCRTLGSRGECYCAVHPSPSLLNSAAGERKGWAYGRSTPPSGSRAGQKQGLWLEPVLRAHMQHSHGRVQPCYCTLLDPPLIVLMFYHLMFTLCVCSQI